MEKSFTKHVFMRSAMLLLVTLLTAVTAWADNVTYIDASGGTDRRCDGCDQRDDSDGFG